MRTLPILLLAIIGAAYCYPVGQDEVRVDAVEEENGLVEVDHRVKRDSNNLEKRVEKIVSLLNGKLWSFISWLASELLK